LGAGSVAGRQIIEAQGSEADDLTSVGARSSGREAVRSAAMRVLIDTTHARRARWSGTAVYLERLAAELDLLEGVDVVELSNARRRPAGGGGWRSARNLLADRWWLAVELPRLARGAGADVIHHPLPAIARAPGLAQVATVHDLSFERLPECFDRAFRLVARRTHRSAALTAHAVICVSQTTAADVRSLWSVPGERIVVAPHGPGQEPAPASATAQGARPYFLYVGDDEPRKNLGCLLEAYASYRGSASDPIELVFAGSVSPRAAAPGVRIERHPDRRRLSELYGAAAALVHPSLYEGFGLTALEAMSAGTPVIAARSPGLTEVCGDAALYADPRASSSFAARMAEIASTPELRRDLSERGRVRAAGFTWAACARAHVDAYSLACTTVTAHEDRHPRHTRHTRLL
jgi:glycosyltransferase involved in cell wall biosynthesis